MKSKIKKIFESDYKGYQFIICEMENMYKMAYIKMKDEFRNYDYGEIFKKSIDCHGGISWFSAFGKEDVRSSLGFCLGWDYGHFWDYHPIYNPNGKKYSVTDIIKEIKDVIEQIIYVEQRIKNSDV